MIVTVTLNPAVDHTLQVEQFPSSGTVARTDKAQLDAGGKGINVSSYLDELGTDTVATGAVGGFLGEFIRTRLDEDGIANDFVDIEGQTRLNTTVLADDEEYKLNHRGPTVAPETVDDVVATIEQYDPWMVVIAGSLPPGATPADLDRIAAAGQWKTAVDVSGQSMCRLDATYDICKPNREELAAATEAPVDTLDQCAHAVEQLRQQGFARVVASLGADGALMATDDRILHAPSPTVDVHDTVGAGDGLLAGVLSELERGNSDRTALSVGVTVGSHVVQVPGTNVPPFTDVQDDAESVPVSVRKTV